jgi:hypothetical protein
LLERRALLSGILVAGAGPGAPPVVHVYSAGTGAELFHFLAYDPRFRGGVSVAVGDLGGDGSQEIVTAPGPGIRPQVKVFRGSNGAEIGRFFVPGGRLGGGLTVAVGDVTGGGREQIVTGDGGGSSRVSVFQGADGGLISSFRAYASSFHGGVNLALGDLNRDGHDDIVTAPRAGTAPIEVFDGRSLKVLARFRAYSNVSSRGVAVSVGHVISRGTLDIITASAAGLGPGASVKLFSGRSFAQEAQFRMRGRGYSSGARIAAIDGNGDHIDKLALSPARGSGIVVLDTSSLRLGALGSFLLQGNLVPMPVKGSAPPPVAYRVSTGSARGVFLAATSSVSESTPGALAADARPSPLPLTPIQRLAYFDVTTGQFVPVTPNDPRLVGKDVTVIVHGWAPGYITWVQNAAALGQPLEWWQTFPGQPGYNASISGGLAPDSAWLLDGHTEGSIVVASQGLVQDILASDPNAAVLAYSWIDDSATPVSSSTGIPEDVYLSEAKTTLNGERLAFAIQQVLGTETQFQGKLQLLGHSHGSKVATVAAVALTNDATPIRVDQLTLLDSPESSDTKLGTLLAEEGASNNNWYFLQGLNINRQNNSSTFVDNYISYFDEPFDAIAYPGSNPNLGQVVDVSLDAEPYSFTDPGGQHSYAAYWYAGSSEPNLTYGNSVARMWSPLLPGNNGPTNPPQDLSPSYEQAWNFFNYSQMNQFDLETYTPSALNPVFNPVTLPETTTPGVSVTNTGDGASVALTQQNGALQSYTGSFTTAAGHPIRGLTFNYQFQNFAPGDELTISVDGDLGFVMDADLIQSPSAPVGTITIGDLFSGESHTVTFTLTSTQPNSTSSVVISNLNQFADE